MELEKLVKRLERLTGGERVPENTIKNWAHTEKIIPTPIGGGKGGRVSGGEARKADWPAEALEQAAAVWWVRKTYRRMYGKKKKKLSKDQINVIKRAASVLDKSPFAIYHLPPVTGPLSTQQIAPEAITMTFASDDFDGISLFLGNKEKKLECLNTLVVAWVAAREKVRAWAYNRMSVTDIVEHYPEPRPSMLWEFDFSKIEPWQGDVPCPWRIDKPACVALFYWSHPSKNQNENRKFWTSPFPYQRRLHESKCDSIVLYENFVDTRELFKIEVADPKENARAELEKIEPELDEKEREVQRLGISFATFLAMEERPLETLTEEEKIGLKTMREITSLGMRRGWLKASFGV